MGRKVRDSISKVAVCCVSASVIYGSIEEVASGSNKSKKGSKLIGFILDYSESLIFHNFFLR